MPRLHPGLGATPKIYTDAEGVCYIPGGCRVGTFVQKVIISILAPPLCDFGDLGLAGIMVGQHDILRQTNHVYNLTVLAAHLKKKRGINHFDNQ